MTTEEQAQITGALARLESVAEACSRRGEHDAAEVVLGARQLVRALVTRVLELEAPKPAPAPTPAKARGKAKDAPP